MIKWAWQFQRMMDLLRSHSFATAFANNLKNLAYLTRNGKVDCYWDDDMADKKSLEYLAQIKASPKFLQDWSKNCEKKCKALVEFAKNTHKKDIKRLSIEEIYQLYDVFVSLNTHAGFFAWFIRCIVHKAVPEFEKLLKQKVGNEEKFQKYRNILTATSKESFVGEEEREIHALAFEIIEKKLELNDDKVIQKIKKHEAKFKWIPCSYYDEEPYKTEYFLQKIKHIIDDQQTAKRVLHTIKGMRKKLQQQQEKIMKELDFDEPTQNLIQCLQECVYYKDFVRGALNKSYCYLYPFFEELGKRCNLSKREIKYLFPEEVKETLFNNKDYIPLIKERIKFNVLINKDGKLITLFGKEAQALVDEIEQATVKEVTEIKGMCASPGYAKAKVKIVIDFGDIQNETHDFILVASMTTPEYTVAMEKALAIVTDEGGITCHAAIVAREMNKPCVIGTKIATKVFHHGDIIEVDANKGIVRKIQKA